jgi:hypothetical protein
MGVKLFREQQGMCISQPGMFEHFLHFAGAGAEDECGLIDAACAGA